MYLTCACLKRGTDLIKNFLPPCWRRDGVYDLIWTPGSLGPRLTSVEDLSAQGLCFLSSSPAPCCQAASLDQNSTLIWWHASMGFKHQLPLRQWQIWREKKQQWSFNKFIMKTNGPCINHLPYYLKTLAYSDIETTRVNFRIMEAQPLGGA